MSKKSFMAALLLIAVCAGTSIITSCSKDDVEDNKPNVVNGGDKPSGDNGDIIEITVIVNEDGTTSNGSIFSALDDKNFYIDYIKYTVKDGHLQVTGYDNAGFNGVANIISKLTYKGNTYEVLEMKNGIFEKCNSLTSVIIGSGVKELGREIFLGCKRLTSVIIGNGLKSIGSETFYGCTSLSSINIPSSVTSINGHPFYNCYFVENAFVNNSSLTSNDNWGATLCDEETNDGILIKANTVVSCRPWSISITIPASVNDIASNIFRNCIDLTSIKVETRNRKYDSRDNCNAIIETATNTLIAGWYNTIIPNSVTSIGRGAFSSCTSLTSVIIKAKTPPTVFDNTSFSNPSKVTLYVPIGCKAAYQAAEHWRDFKEIIEMEMED